MTIRPLPVATGDNRLGALVADLHEKGWSWQPGLLPDDLFQGLRSEILAFDGVDALAPAGIGREDDYQLDRTVRKARISWLDGQSPAQAAFFDWADELRAALNRSLMLGLFELEACYAVYPEGGFYDRHLDSFEGARNRIVSLVIYLNDAWSPKDGGAILIWPEGAENMDPPVAEILPEGAGVVVMLSETVPHAVAETHRRRYGMAAWWRVNPSVLGRVDPLS